MSEMGQEREREREKERKRERDTETDKMFSRTSSLSRPNRCAIARMRAGRNDPLLVPTTRGARGGRSATRGGQARANGASVSVAFSCARAFA